MCLCWQEEEAGGASEIGDDAAMEEEENGAPTGPLEESGYIVDDPNDPGEILFTAVMGHRDVTGRIVSLMFRKLPRQQEFPAYYEIIDNPIDLCDIAIKIKVRLKIEKSDFMETSILFMICHDLNYICKMLNTLWIVSGKVNHTLLYWSIVQF